MLTDLGTMLHTCFVSYFKLCLINKYFAGVDIWEKLFLTYSFPSHRAAEVGRDL